MQYSKHLAEIANDHFIRLIFSISFSTLWKDKSVGYKVNMYRYFWIVGGCTLQWIDDLKNLVLQPMIADVQ